MLARSASVLLIALCAASAHAQSEPDGGSGTELGDEAEAARTGARALFLQGLDLAGRRNFHEAAQMFRAARELHVAPAIDYNLASALFELDQLTEAGLLVDGVLDGSETPESVREPALVLKEKLRERAGRIEVLYDGPLEGVTVVVDGQSIPRLRIGSEVAVTPGSRVVVASRDAAEIDREEVEVAAGQMVSITLDLSVEDAVTPPPPPPPPPVEPTIFSDWRFWGAIGAGVLVVTAVLVLAFVRFGVEDPIEGNFDPAVITWD
jgi:hypothetical protein